MGELRAALFDIDGTLIDSNHLHVQAWVEAFAGAGREVEADAVAPLIGMGGDKLVPTLWPDADEAMQERLSDAHGAAFKGRYMAQAQPFPGARDLVARVHEVGLKVVLATSASDEEVDHYVDLLGIRDMVVTKTSIDEVEESKPAPDIFATALKKAGVAAEAAIAIGDAPYDVEAAGKSGVSTIALLSGGFPRERLEGSVAIYEDAADLLRRFEDSPLVE